MSEDGITYGYPDWAKDSGFSPQPSYGGWGGYGKFAGPVQYDVANTLGRAASSLLSKGVTIELGPPSTDCESIIYLPQAMKRWLGGTEIDLVRYLVAHEQAHIKYSSPTYINTWEGYPVHNIVSQACEDIRIEAKAMQEFVGNNETIRRGRKIAIDKWEQTFDP